jgi:hypothetical protein
MTRSGGANPGPVTIDLAGLLADCWQRLQAGARDANNALHTPAVGTLGDTGCQVRTVVLRRVEPARRRIACHTDTRSAKAGQLAAHPRMAWLFYDAAARVQIRAEGGATVHTDDALADAQWRASRLLSRRCYIGTAPGKPSDLPTTGLPEHLRGRAPREGESEAGRPHFAVIACEVDVIDRLDLAVDGHRRARWAWRGGTWDGTWIAP